MGRFEPLGQGAKAKRMPLPICPSLFLRNAQGHWGFVSMDKSQLIESIREINRTAKAEFLAEFTPEELVAYLEHLMELEPEEMVAAN